MFRFTDLVPGIYELTAEREGFAMVHEAGVTIVIGRLNTLCITLEPA
jgi:hypothetical protein